MKIIEAGFPEDKVYVIPHGYSEEIYYPLTLEEKLEARRGLGIPEDAFVVLNLGAMIHNKGIDILVRAFAEFRKSNPKAILLLKDDKNLYGIGAQGVVGQILQQYPECNTPELVSSVKLLSATLPLSEMRKLYGLADVYASPYRAEGFNLPVLEAMACGVRVIVTKGGATDDFAPNDVDACEQIASTLKQLEPDEENYILEPDLTALSLALSKMSNATPNFRNGLAKQSHWSEATRRMSDLMSY
jgi:glycosyltransferase involved in cell wall biosynthesis